MPDSIQMMLELLDEHPWMCNCFTQQGFHAVRRSNQQWAGLWTDLIIEQVMMTSIKSCGGFVRGRGITETVRLQRIYGMHHCAGIHDAMTALTNIKHKTSEQRVELSSFRCNQDFKGADTPPTPTQNDLLVAMHMVYLVLLIVELFR